MTVYLVLRLFNQRRGKIFDQRRGLVVKFFGQDILYQTKTVKTSYRQQSVQS